MPDYQFDDVIVPHDAPDLQTHLRAAYHGKQRPLCRCQSPGVPMYIARLDDRYLIKRMPDSGALHASDPLCPSYEPPEVISGLGEVKGEAIREDIEAGITTLRLGFSLSKLGGKAPPEPSDTKPDSVKTDGKKLTMRGTLHYLWEEAGLNRWVPAMAGKRSWYVARRALLEAVGGKIAKKLPLEELLFVPESFSVEHADAIAQRRVSRLMPLSGNSKRLMMVVAEAKEITTSRNGFKLIAKHLPDFPFLMNEDINERLQKVFASELAMWDSIEDSHLVFLATFGMPYAGVAKIESITVMVTTQNWIPVEDTFQKTLIDTLTHEHRRFMKSLRYNLSQKKPLACAVLTDVRPQAVALYIDGSEESDELNALIEESGMPSWIWRAGEAMPPLPPAGGAHQPASALDVPPAPTESAW